MKAAGKWPNDENQPPEEQKTGLNLPLSRVKQIFNLSVEDDQKFNIQKNALVLLTKATEMFV